MKLPNTIYLHIALSSALALGSLACQTVGDSLPDKNPDQTGEPDPIKVIPDSGKPDGSDATTQGCDGATAGGTCTTGVASYCDIATGSVRQVDCRALDRECVIEAGGATCAAVSNPDPGQPTDPCGGLADYQGFCSAEGNAVWCDVDNDILNSWDCSAEGMGCSVDDCAEGAFCCQVSSPDLRDCPELGYEGECVGDLARFCSGANNETLIQRNCAADNQVCAVDVCSEGAYCCEKSVTPPDQPQCPDAGFAGACFENKVYWCDSIDRTHIVDCSATGQTCNPNGCDGAGAGALCC